jgi:aspartyl/asparaginyl-tRNA synthetase
MKNKFDLKKLQNQIKMFNQEFPSMNPKHYAYVVKKIREVCDEEGLVECYLNDYLSTLSSCESPTSIRTFEWMGIKFAHQQTTQMCLERLINERPECKGYYNIGNSYREEEHPVKNRHKHIFCLGDFELQGDMEDLIQFQKKILLKLGIKPFDGQVDFPRIDYLDACTKYGVDEIGHDEEIRLCQDFNSPAVFLCKFPLSTKPFFNMQIEGDVALKVDVIIGNPNGGQPMEVFGSAQRSDDPDDMRRQFHSIGDGEYAQALYSHFGKERIDKELEEYLSLKFVPRSGMGIGINRLVFACETLGIFKNM